MIIYLIYYIVRTSEEKPPAITLKMRSAGQVDACYSSPDGPYMPGTGTSFKRR